MAKTYQASLWSQMAEEARVVAGCLHDDELQLCVLAVAERYDALAKRARFSRVATQSSLNEGARWALRLGFVAISLHPGLYQDWSNGVQRCSKRWETLNSWLPAQ